MRFDVWRYRCESCGAEFDGPGFDSSFFYGTFVAYSSNLEIAIWDSCETPLWDEFSALVEADPRAGGISDYSLGDLIRGVASRCLDPDSRGAAFAFAGHCFCPYCDPPGEVHPAGSRDGDWPDPGRAVTSVRWDGLSDEDKAREVRVALDVLLGRPG
ncbi:hypothetical protein [Streptacidiphilus jiangxiensis]|uniref:Uncharacterized protein n=1 Tax=Streptacidiphilus jiangxiensis TaxID=235985 RepID=A0A1H7P1J9_STRJI|nr:hypothetical protein [Streptacidiphilus jiangxiensis]SEL29188.1 hypothetical protein SAMN05414137_107158 [Streptacidiphilus jiangxiensis]